MAKSIGTFVKSETTSRETRTNVSSIVILDSFSYNLKLLGTLLVAGRGFLKIILGKRLMSKEGYLWTKL